MIFDEETVEELIENGSIDEVGIKIRPSEAHGGVFIIKKAAIIFNNTSSNLIGRNLKGDTLKIKQGYDSGEIVIYDEAIDTLRKVDTWIDDVYHLECARPPILNLPDDFDPKTEIILFSLFT